ncbi:putative membrane protein [Nitrolancea hollandica]|uniref:Putative membrane protein n=1 Tax=Nitrolancea hollandica Lb TaxID=1129897 RepID=I4EG64_9BACT|nr:putative membrane protein [Nitrolancea hollandica]CCF83676.1 putative membrane protein [Nitrolancea hollandica Lb]
MEPLATVLLVLHIGSGMVALFVAPGAMLTRKGALWHRRWGRIFFWSMAAVAATALPLSLIHPSLFLALIAVFSFYMAFSGYRVTRRKHPDLGERATRVDWMMVIVTLVVSLGLVGYGLWDLVMGNGAGAAAVVFGLLGAILAARDLRAFIHPPSDRYAWLFFHMGNMLGAYIATVSAFSVTNFEFLPPAVRWMWPTVAGVPAIFFWIGRYQRKFKRQQPVPSRLAAPGRQQA